MKRALPPAASICPTVSRPPASATSATTTAAPSFAKRSAASRPMPLPAPVINATLSFKRIGSDPLEEARALPAGDDLVELPLLGAQVVEVVVHDGVAEGGARERAPLQVRDRLAESRRYARQ